jgi:transaldolase
MSFGIEIYADLANVMTMRNLDAQYPGVVGGFTTNPTLMRSAGVEDYETFARQALEVSGERPISFEVVADDLPGMERQGRRIASWGGGNVFVKIPVTTTTGESTGPVIHALAESGVHVNVTAVFTMRQVERVAADLGEYSDRAIVSVFAGRIANAGHDPRHYVSRCKHELDNMLCHADVLWASSRQVYDVVQARRAGATIITLTPMLIDQLHVLDRDLTEYSLDTVKMFRSDALAAGYEL